MKVSEKLEESLEELNIEQRKAVEHLDGPLLVIAGPGTGKTQILSLRAANILAKRDVAPTNILCLTFTDAGAEAMRKRLIQLIGRDAYGVHVSTFHGFADFVRSRYSEHFSRPASDRLVSSLRQNEIMDSLLKKLPYGSPLSAVGSQGVSFYTEKMLSFVSTIKQSGISFDVLVDIANQNIAAADWLEEHSALCEILAARASKTVAEKFEEEVQRACALAPHELKTAVVSTSGIYVPFIRYLQDSVSRTELIDEKGKTSGLRAIRDSFFSGTKAGRCFSIRKVSEKLLAACEIACQYQHVLAEEHLYDFNDMIYDFVLTVERDAELRQKLQDTYTYIQVDEFQDTNGSQLRIVELLCNGIKKPNIMVVGDDDQAIMRFQGASVECIEQFQEFYRPENVVLKTNYRSTPALVELGQKVAAQVERRLQTSEEKAIVAHNPDEDQIEFNETVFASAAEEYAALAESIRERIDSGYQELCDNPDEAIAVIASKHAILRALIPYLVKQNIPFAYKQTQNLFTSERMQTMLALIYGVVALSQGRKKLAESCLPQLVCSAEFGIDSSCSIDLALKARRLYRGNWLAAMRKSDHPRIQELYKNLIRWSAQVPSAPVRSLLFDMASKPLAFYRSISANDPLAAAEFNAGMRAMLKFVNDELDLANSLDRPLRLNDVVERLDTAKRFGVNIEASINLEAPGAICLTSAHSSKGFEFDCVYLADADNRTWHTGGSGTTFFPSNTLIDNAREDDDVRRLLFVAITRAKRHLEIFRTGENTLQELSGEIGIHEVSSEPLDLDVAIETDWHASYLLDTPELVSLVDVRNDLKHLSASALNAFVAYREGCSNSLTFPLRNIMRLPEPPNIASEFGNIVHAFLEDVIRLTMGPEKRSLNEVVARHRDQIECLDFPRDECERYVQRFDYVVKAFVPWLLDRAVGLSPVTEVRMEVATHKGTPLFGFIDLMLIDEAAKTIRIIDYKTGKNKIVTASYERQLCFYKLMLTLSPEFKGYEVVSVQDCYVEPDIESGEFIETPSVAATDDDLIHLEELIDAVWACMQAGQWDTSSFEESEFYLEAIETAKSLRSKKEKERTIQQAYESWLIEQWV